MISIKKGFSMKTVLLYIIISIFSLTQSLFGSDDINIKETKEQANKVTVDEYKWGSTIVDDQSFNLDNLPKNDDYKPCAEPKEIKQCGPN